MFALAGSKHVCSLNISNALSRIKHAPSPQTRLTAAYNTWVRRRSRYRHIIIIMSIRGHDLIKTTTPMIIRIIIHCLLQTMIRTVSLPLNIFF